MNSKIYTATSDLNGIGVFTKEKFTKNEVVLKWNYKTLSSKEYSKLTTADKKCVSKIDGVYIHFQPPACYMNHSCEPNTKIGKNCNIALRDIDSGEELTTDYTLEGVDIDFPCTCRSKNCAFKNC